LPSGGPIGTRARMNSQGCDRPTGWVFFHDATVSSELTSASVRAYLMAKLQKQKTAVVVDRPTSRRY